jgi:hypothetical protein
MSISFWKTSAEVTKVMEPLSDNEDKSGDKLFSDVAITLPDFVNAKGQSAENYKVNRLENLTRISEFVKSRIEQAVADGQSMIVISDQCFKDTLKEVNIFHRECCNTTSDPKVDPELYFDYEGLKHIANNYDNSNKYNAKVNAVVNIAAFHKIVTSLPGIKTFPNTIIANNCYIGDGQHNVYALMITWDGTTPWLSDSEVEKAIHQEESIDAMKGPDIILSKHYPPTSFMNVGGNFRGNSSEIIDGGNFRGNSAEWIMKNPLKSIFGQMTITVATGIGLVFLNNYLQRR